MSRLPYLSSSVVFAVFVVQESNVHFYQVHAKSLCERFGGTS